MDRRNFLKASVAVVAGSLLSIVSLEQVIAQEPLRTFEPSVRRRELKRNMGKYMLVECPKGELYATLRSRCCSGEDAIPVYSTEEQALEGIRRIQSRIPKENLRAVEITHEPLLADIYGKSSCR